MVELKVLKNKANGQVTITIPKAVAEMFDINENSKLSLKAKPQKAHEFVLRVESKGVIS